MKTRDEIIGPKSAHIFPERSSFSGADHTGQTGFGFMIPHDDVIGSSAGVTFVENVAKSVINRVKGTRLSDFFSVNPYRGCEHACVYCYARYTHEFFDLKPGEEFQRRIYVKVNGPEVFFRDLRRVKGLANQQILFGSATDPYQPAESKFQITRRMLEKLLPLKGLSIGVITKSPLIERDLDLFLELANRHDLEVLISCAFCEEDTTLQRRLEPRVASPKRRLETLAKFCEAKIPTSLLCAPILPGINDSQRQLGGLLRCAKEAGALNAAGQTLFLSSATKEPFFRWLQQNRPELLDGYERGYREGLELRQDWREVIEERLWRARMIAGFCGKNDRHHRDDKVPREFMSVDDMCCEPSPEKSVDWEK